MAPRDRWAEMRGFTQPRPAGRIGKDDAVVRSGHPGLRMVIGASQLVAPSSAPHGTQVVPVVPNWQIATETAAIVGSAALFTSPLVLSDPRKGTPATNPDRNRRRPEIITDLRIRWSDFGESR